MIKLSDETRVLKVKTKEHEIGDTIDNSVYLKAIDANNIALVRGTSVLNYFGDVQTALKRSLNYIIKGSEKELTLLRMEKQIEELHKAIEGIKK